MLGGRQAGWGRLVGRLASWQAGQHVGKQAKSVDLPVDFKRLFYAGGTRHVVVGQVRLASKQTNRLAGAQAGRLSSSLLGRLASWLAGKLAGWQVGQHLD